MIAAEVEPPPAPLRLDANEPADSGLDLAALVASAAGTLHRYPVAPSRLTDAIAARHAVPADRVLLGAGSADLITLAWRVCTGPGRTAAFGTPGFELYALLCRQFGRPARTWPVATPSDVLPGEVVFDGPAVGLVAVSNPHNPTGSRVPRTAVAQLADRLPAGAVLLNDEAYAEYVEDEPGDVTLAELSARPNVISTRTFSKLYGLPALRVGYAVADPALIRRLAALRTPHMVSQLGALGALQALRDDAAVAARRQRTASCRGRLSCSGVVSPSPMPAPTSCSPIETTTSTGPRGSPPTACSSRPSAPLSESRFPRSPIWTGCSAHSTPCRAEKLDAHKHHRSFCVIH
jgi:histidinol-phosphate aminotransferase